MEIRGTLSVTEDTTLQGNVDISGDLHFSSQTEIGLFNLDNSGTPAATNMALKIGVDTQTVKMKKIQIGTFGSPSATISETGAIVATNIEIKGNIVSEDDEDKSICVDVTTNDVEIGGTGSTVKVVNFQVGADDAIGATIASDGTTTINGAVTVNGDVTISSGNHLKVSGDIECNTGTTNANRNIFTDLDTNGVVTIGGTAGTVSVPGKVEIGGGYGSTGVTIENDGNLKIDGALTLSGNIVAKTGTTGTARTIFGTVTNTITIGADSSEVIVGTLNVKKKLVLTSATSGFAKIMRDFSTHTADDLPSGTHGEIRYLHNTGTSPATFDDGGSNPITVPAGAVYEIMYLDLADTSNDKWYVVGTG